jgi:4-hydroxy-2-oxoglutarate aldolase
VLVRTAYYYAGQMSSAAVLHYFRSVADRSPLPVILYNIPKCVPYQIPVEVIAELAEHPNIIGIKDSSGSIDRIRDTVAATQNSRRRTVTVTPIFEAVTGRVLSSKTEVSGTFIAAGHLAGGTALATAPPATPMKTRTKEVGFQVLSGSASALLGSLKEGASGGILAFAACAPQACQEIHQAWKDHDIKLAEEKQNRVSPANKRIVGDLGIAGVKYACDFNGYFGGRPRSPLLGLNAEQKREVETLLSEMRN